MKKLGKYIIIGIASFVIILLGFYNLLKWTKQGDYLKYNNGVTVEVYNSSEDIIKDLNFYFAFDGNHVFLDLGTISQLKPEETSSLYNHHIKGTGNDRSLYFRYPINISGTKFESLLYLPSNKPNKVVVQIEITGTGKGELLYRVKGYENTFGQFDF